MGPAVLGAQLPARGTATLEFEVAPPVWIQPGDWWALIRVAAAGRLVYSPAVAVSVRPR
jgi:alpha-mannosidase